MQPIPTGASGSFDLLVTPEHLASRFKDSTLPPVPAGRHVVGHAVVTHVDGRRIEFSVRAVDGDEEIGAGTHERVVILREKLAERLKSKFGR